MSLTVPETDCGQAGPGLAPQLMLRRADLLAVVGHDLRQPLSAAIMAVEIVAELLDLGSCGELAQAHLGLAQRCMRETLLLADDLMAIGEAEAAALKCLVEAHGGRIEACAGRAGGLTVAFTIPLGTTEPASGGPPDGGLPE